MTRFSSQDRGGGQGSRGRGSSSHDSGGSVPVLFDPERAEKDLYGDLAETQAGYLSINSSQLRKFFGEAKELYRQFNALIASISSSDEKQQIYAERIEARFLMLRSKIAYAKRPNAQSRLDAGFANFMDQGIRKVRNQQDFVRFILHFEAVVGFMYGMEKVKK
jgi:CRISPR type III-A-associated protein Csm2